jgi:hypothetical protein
LVVGLVVGFLVVGFLVVALVVALVVVVDGCVNTNGWPTASDLHIVPLPGIDEGVPVRYWIAVLSDQPFDEPQLLVIKVILGFLPTIPPPPVITPAL